MTATHPSDQCARPRKKDGQRCTLPLVWGDSCHLHLTAGERVAYVANRDAYRAAFAAQFEAAAGLPGRPACHSWPAPRSGQTLLDWFPDLCALCGRSGADVMDHCHDTGLARGRLCSSCNWREGRARYEPFIAYRLRPPAVILGWTYLYDHDNWSTGEPESCVVDVLGPMPDDPQRAAEYLADWAMYVRRADRKRDNPLRKMGL